jgi:hypothetical protein
LDYYASQVPTGSRKKVAWLKRIYWTTNHGAPPYNNRFDRNNVVRHAPCLRKGRAGTAVSLLLRRRETAQRCPLNRALYGRNKDSVNVDDMNYRRAA